MTWMMFLVIIIVIYIGLGIVIPFGFIFGYSGIMRTKVNFLHTLKQKEQELQEQANNSKKSHMHESSTTKHQ